MKVTFLEARVPLTKKYTASTKQPYPNAFEFKSHEHFIKDLPDFTAKLGSHAALGHCLLKGELDQPLEWESRAGHTNANKPTRWVCLDIDGLTSVPDIPAFMAKIGLQDISYVLQWSASHGVYGDFSLRAHVFVFLTEDTSPAVLKLWLRQLNLTCFEPDLELTKTNTALRWGLDVTTCQSDKLIFISPPSCTPASLDQFTGMRVQYVKRTKEFFDFSTVALKTAEQLKKMEEQAINKLRKAINLEERKTSQFKLKEYKGEQYMPNPDEATVTSFKSDRGFVYLNLNGGDSWGYYHPEDNPTFIYNFKGEPTYRTSELVPDYWAQLQTAKKQAAQTQHQGKLFLAFRDFRSAEYLNGWYDQGTEELVLHTAKSEKQLADFLKNYGQGVPEAVPIWQVVYDPHAPTLDLNTRTVNTFKPSTFMRFAQAQAKLKPAKPTPNIMRVITNVVGADMVDHLINWLAYIFVHRSAPKTAWVWHGTQGTGKGILLNNVLKPILGESNVSIKRMEELEDKFNDHLENCLLCFVDEAQISDSGRSKMIMANLKNQITEPTITIRRMRQSSYEVPNRVGWIFASNMADPVTIESSDRRHNVGDYQINKLEITDAQLKAIEGELMDFAFMLQTYPIDIDAVRTPRVTEAKKQMIMVSRSSADTVADAIIHGDLSALWDALPTVETSMLDTATAIKLQPYKQLIYDLVLNKRGRITREELFVIFNYNVGNVPASPWKLTSYLKHHGLQVKDIRMGEKVTKGVLVTWANTDEWFAARTNEINIEKGVARPLKVVAQAAS